MQGIKKKLVAALTVVALVVSALATALPAYAATGTGTLVVTGDGLVGSDSSNPNKVYALQMFSAEVNGASVSYTLNDQFKTFFQNEVSSCSGKDDIALSETAYAYVNALGKNDSTEVTNFAKLAADYVDANWDSFKSGLKTATVAAGSEGQKDTATFSSLEFGYYLVLPFGSSNTTRGTYAILDSVLSAGSATKIDLKSEYPTVDKTIVENPDVNDQDLGIVVDGSWDGNHDLELSSLDPMSVDIDEASDGKGSTAAVGDVVTFELTSKVPDMSQYETYVFKITDTLSKGLTLLDSVANPNVVIKIGDTVLKSSDFTAAATGGSGSETVLTIDLRTYLTQNKDTLTVGDEIVIRYQAKVNEDAVIVDESNKNSAKVEFSNDPNGTGTGTSTTTETHTYTFGFTINKVDDKNAALANAEFKIYKDDGDGKFDSSKDDALTFVNKRTSDGVTKYMLDDDQAGEPTTIKTDANDFMVCGLGEGTYWIEEVNAPEGYNKLSGPMKVTIEATFKADGTIDSHTIKAYNPDGSEITDIIHPNHTITIVNKTGAELPGTGGMGTVIFTVVGVAVVAGGAIWMVQRNRRNAASNGSHMA